MNLIDLLKEFNSATGYRTAIQVDFLADGELYEITFSYLKNHNEWTHATFHSEEKALEGIHGLILIEKNIAA